MHKTFVVWSWFVLVSLLVACNANTPTSPPPTAVVPTAAPTQTSLSTITPTATVAPAAIPSSRGGHTTAYDSESKRVIMYGGETGNTQLESSFSYETWAFDPASSIWIKMAPAVQPGGVYGDMAYNSKADRVFLVVNANPTSIQFDYQTSQTWAYDFNTDTWTQLADGPSGRLGARIVYDSKADKIILFGGYKHGQQFTYNETWAYDFETDTWKQMQPKLSPEARDFHCMAYDSAADRTVVWGGDVGTPKYKLAPTLWVYDYSANTWTEVKHEGPVGFDNFAMVYDEKADVFIIFGGIPPTTVMTWVYDLNSNTWRKMEQVQNPGPLTAHTLAYDSNLDRSILFGGQLGGVEFNYVAKTWVYDLNANTWTNVSP